MVPNWKEEESDREAAREVRRLEREERERRKEAERAAREAAREARELEREAAREARELEREERERRKEAERAARERACEEQKERLRQERERQEDVERQRSICGDDELYTAALEVVKRTRRARASSIQRALRIGYTRAARLLDRMEEEGIVGPERGAEPREILVDFDEAGNIVRTQRRRQRLFASIAPLPEPAPLASDDRAEPGNGDDADNPNPRNEGESAGGEDGPDIGSETEEDGEERMEWDEGMQYLADLFGSLDRGEDWEDSPEPED